MRSRTLPALVAAAAVAAALGSAAPALAAPPAGTPAARAGHGQGGGNQHSIDAHLRKELRKAAKATGAVIDTGTPGSGGLLGAPEGSYPLTSSTYSMGKFGDSPEVLATCGSGYYVDYNSGFDPEMGAWLYQLNIDVHGSSSFVDSASGYPKAWNQIGSDSNGVPLYQGFSMKLSNDNPLYSNTGFFTWTCDPLGA